MYLALIIRSFKRHLQKKLSETQFRLLPSFQNTNSASNESDPKQERGSVEEVQASVQAEIDPNKV